MFLVCLSEPGFQVAPETSDGRIKRFILCFLLVPPKAMRPALAGFMAFWLWCRKSANDLEGLLAQLQLPQFNPQ